MKLRQANKILRHWSRHFHKEKLPKEASKEGSMPWKWSTWETAHYRIGPWFLDHKHRLENRRNKGEFTAF